MMPGLDTNIVMQNGIKSIRHEVGDAEALSA